MFIFTRQMTDLGKISAIYKIWEKINTTLPKHQEGPRRQGKQPTKKISRGRWGSLHKRYYWLINILQDVQPHCWLRKYELKGIYIHFLSVEDSITNLSSASEVMRKRTVPLSCHLVKSEWQLRTPFWMSNRQNQKRKTHTYPWAQQGHTQESVLQ